MTKKQDALRSELAPLIAAALDNGQIGELEAFLVAHSHLSPSMLNLTMIHSFADLIGDYALQHPEHPQKCLQLLDQWAALNADRAPVGDPCEILPAAAILSTGQIAACVPLIREDLIARLYLAAGDSRWRMREMVAAAFQRMLAADWANTIAVLRGWLADTNPLVIRAVAAAVADPPLLKIATHGEDAVGIQSEAVDWFQNIPAVRRRDEDVRVLRQGLGYTVSVAVVAAPDTGFVLLDKMAATEDTDIQWIVRENLKKNRLQHWPDNVERLRERTRL